MSRFKYDVKLFLDELATSCAELSLAGKQFTTDPERLYKQVATAAERVAADVMYLEALRDNRWVVAKSADDGRWRVWSGDTGKIVAGIKDGGDDWEDALDIAMVAKAFSEAQPVFGQPPVDSDPNQSSD